MSSIVLVDATDDSLTVSWPESTDPTATYTLQYRSASNSVSTDDDGAFQTLSETLKSPQVRKRNLPQDPLGFVFRARVNSESSSPSWITHTEPFLLLTPSEQESRPLPPQVHLGGSHLTLRVKWKSSGEKCELQLRENVPGTPWTTIASSVASEEVRKKNLPSPAGYQFRFRPLSKQVFSPPSEPVVALGLSAPLQRLIGENTVLLQKPSTPIPLTDGLGGKEFVLLYVSAHWCGPCRQFTPQLAQWYQSLGGGGAAAGNSTVQVVFLSADHDGQSFAQYYGSMPWLAVDYEDDRREELMGFLRVSGIPRLAVVDGRTGRIVEDNAVGKPLDVDRWRSLAK